MRKDVPSKEHRIKKAVQAVQFVGTTAATKCLARLAKEATNPHVMKTAAAALQQLQVSGQE
jgi:hypothetical protein